MRIRRTKNKIETGFKIFKPETHFNLFPTRAKHPLQLVAMMIFFSATRDDLFKPSQTAGLSVMSFV